MDGNRSDFEIECLQAEQNNASFDGPTIFKLRTMRTWIIYTQRSENGDGWNPCKFTLFAHPIAEQRHTAAKLMLYVKQQQRNRYPYTRGFCNAFDLWWVKSSKDSHRVRCSLDRILVNWKSGSFISIDQDFRFHAN
jgi:hypothetical protein